MSVPRTAAGRELARQDPESIGFILAIEAEAAADPVAGEALRTGLEHVLDVWPAPSPEEFARIHRVLTSRDSCDHVPAPEGESA